MTGTMQSKIVKGLQLTEHTFADFMTNVNSQLLSKVWLFYNVAVQFKICIDQNVAYHTVQ